MTSYVLRDLVDMPGFNPATQHDRGEWGLRCVSDGTVTPDRWWKPRCVDHGAMNAVNPDCTLWRCLMCGHGCFRP